MPFGESITYADTRFAARPDNRQAASLLKQIESLLVFNLKVADRHGLNEIRLSAPRVREIVSNIKHELK